LSGDICYQIFCQWAWAACGDSPISKSTSQGWLSGAGIPGGYALENLKMKNVQDEDMNSKLAEQEYGGIRDGIVDLLNVTRAAFA
jgi:hypothetical protein